MLVQTLERTFLTDHPPGPHAPDEATRATWRRRFDSALFKLRRAGISVRADQDAAFDEYAELRSRWNPAVMSLAPAMGYAEAEVDPEGTPDRGRHATG